MYFQVHILSKTLWGAHNPTAKNRSLSVNFAENRPSTKQKVLKVVFVVFFLVRQTLDGYGRFLRAESNETRRKTTLRKSREQENFARGKSSKRSISRRGASRKERRRRIKLHRSRLSYLLCFFKEIHNMVFRFLKSTLWHSKKNSFREICEIRSVHPERERRNGRKSSSFPRIPSPMSRCRSPFSKLNFCFEVSINFALSSQRKMEEKPRVPGRGTKRKRTQKLQSSKTRTTALNERPTKRRVIGNIYFIFCQIQSFEK